MGTPVPTDDDWKSVLYSSADWTKIRGQRLFVRIGMREYAEYAEYGRWEGAVTANLKVRWANVEMLI